MLFPVHFLLVAGLLFCAATAQSCPNPSNEEEIDRAKNAGRDPPAPICPDQSSLASPSGISTPASSPSQVATPPSPPTSPLSQTMAPTSTPTSSPEGYGDNTASKDSTCVLFNPPNMQATLSMCKNVCGDAVAKQIDAGKTGSVSCLSWTPTGQTLPATETIGGATAIPGKCVCNMPFIDELADTFVEALPKIAEISVQVFEQAFETVAEIGTIPLGGAIGPGLAASVSAARLANFVYDLENAAKAFKIWAQGAGKLPTDMDKVFGALNKPENESLLPGGKFTPPKGVAKGSGKPGDEGLPDPAKTADKDGSSADKPARNDSDKDNKDDKDNKSCKKQKRGGNNDKCDDNGTITSTIVKESSANTKTIPVTCSALQYGQACYNYYSAIQHNKDFNNFPCTDGQDDFRNGLTAVNSWKRQHNSGTGWKSYTTSTYVFQGKDIVNADRKVVCDVDEFPPAYFRSRDHLGQVVRYLPSSPNRSAGKLWQGWCKENDGGEGNGQFAKNNKDLNAALVTKVKNLDKHTEKAKGKDDSDTVFETWSVNYQRAVFSMAFDWKDGDLEGEPNEGNSWGLEINPCWPKPILPGDPGWVLDTDDDWYKKHAPSPDLRDQYRQAPSQDLVNKANAWLQGNQYFKIGGDGGRSQNPRRRKRSLEVSSHGLLGIRDDEFNTTRLLTEEELSNNVEITKCADRTCSQESRALEQSGADEDDSVLFIRGQGPQMTPPAEVEAKPTPASILPRREAARLVESIERRGASPDLPIATGRIGG